MQLPVMPPVKPMLAKPVAEIPPGQLYEPKWDGFRAIVFRDGDEVEIGSRNEKPMTRYFPEVVERRPATFPARAVVDGEIVVADAAGNRLDFEALQQRIHPAASRVRQLTEETPAASSPSTCWPWATTTSRSDRSSERRACSRTRWPADPPVHLTPATGTSTRRSGGSSSSRAPAWTA